MSKSKNVSTALNKAFAELSTVRHYVKTYPLTKQEYSRVKECLNVLGKIRFEYLDHLEDAA